MSITFACPKCQAEYEVDDAHAGMIAECSNCQTDIAIPVPTPIQPSAAPILRSTRTPSPADAARPYKPYIANPSMFRNQPVMFIVLVPLCFVVVGIPFMLIWWLQCKCTTLSITQDRTILRKGILSKHTNEVFHCDVRNIQIKQSLFQRLFKTGYIGISSAGQSGVEIEVHGIPHPDRAKAVIDNYRHR